MLATIAPAAPSIVLPGLTLGASLCRPNARPTRYAAVSEIHTSPSIASSSHEGSAIIARPAGTRTAIPAVASNQGGDAGMPRASQAGTASPQNTVAATRIASIAVPEAASGHAAAAMAP